MLHLTVLTFFTLLTCFAEAHSIKHVVVVMMENRAFDHILGWRPGVEGLKAGMCNRVIVTDEASAKICVTDAAPQVAPCDPHHGVPGTTYKIFGTYAPTADATPKMDGFVADEKNNAATNYCRVMDAFSVSNIPVMNGIADEFALFDRFHASVPGPTWPNRLFHLAGTSAGLTETSTPWFRGKLGSLFPMRTIFDQVHDANLSWKVYVNDTPWELFLETLAHHPERIQLTEQLFEDARNGSLPNFALVNPRAGMNITTGQGSNDQHPDHDVSLGEAFYKDLYEALRAGPQWNDTLLILTYDEHGGFYDHVPPPVFAPAPDDYTSYPDSFKFNRPGVRIPMLLMSPWVPKGLLISDPPAASKPASDSIFELTSIMATTRKLLGIKEGALTKRDAWAATFEYVFDILTDPRTDCPMHLPRAKAPMQSALDEGELPLNGLQTDIATIHGHLSGRGNPTDITKQRDISDWLQDSFETYKRNLRQGNTKYPPPRHNANPYELRCESFVGMKTPYVGSSWSITAGGTPYTKRTIAMALKEGVEIDNWCWTAHPAAGSEVTVTECNGKKRQDWFWESDGTVRPATSAGLCVTSHCLDNLPAVSSALTLEPCSGVFAQHWAYQGAGGGNTGQQDHGMISFGDSIMAIVITKTT